MKEAFNHLSEVTNKGELGNGYKVFFKSTAFQKKDDDKAESIVTQLERMFEEVTAFEADVADKWNK